MLRLYRGDGALPLLPALHPFPWEYQGYLYSYDLRQQRMAQQAKPVGRITYASGEEQTFTDTQKYLDTIREELPYQATTGFRYETLTDDPAVRKAVDDILLDFAGEENPRRGCNYGLTEAGKQALREAADPDRPHTYAWFVMTELQHPRRANLPGLGLGGGHPAPTWTVTGQRNGWASPRTVSPQWIWFGR